MHLFEDILAARERRAVRRRRPMSDEVAFWMYTSGSTGDPKGVKHVQTTPMAAAALMGRNIIGIREDDVVFSAAKLFFSYGMGNALAFPMSVGASTVLWPHRPTPDAVFDIMRGTSRPVLRRADALRVDAGAQGHGRRAPAPTGCGSASRPARRCRARSASAGARSRAATWSTASARPRCSRPFSSNRPGDVRYGSTGKPVPGYELRIVDENGRDVADGEIGELLVRGPTAGEGYWNQRSKSRRTFAGEWTYSGDKFYRDADGYYYYCGRTDDMFKVSGMWVSPFEVEAALVSHEAVFEAAVIGKEDADGLIKPKAFIVLKDGYTADDSLLENSARARQGTRRPVEIPALDRRARRPAAHRHRQDPALQAARHGFAAPVTDFIFRRQFAIEWGHCDPAGIVFNSRFFEFFDSSAWLMFEAALGVPPHELSKDLRHRRHPAGRAQRRSSSRRRSSATSPTWNCASARSGARASTSSTACSSAARLRSRAWRSGSGRAGIPTIPLRMKARAIPDEVIAKFKNV